MKVYIVYSEFRKVIDSGEYTELENYPMFSMKDLEELNGWKDTLISYIKDYVPLQIYA